MNAPAKLLLFAIMLLVGSGCATNALWEEGRFARFHEPATPSNLRLFKGREDQKMLVVYDSQNEENTLIRRRAYWIDVNVTPPENPFRPHFVRTNLAKTLAPIPLANEPTGQHYSAVATNDLHAFFLFRDGKQIAFHDLPVYQDDSARAKQIALTPPAVIADLTIVGGFLFLWWWSVGGVNYWP